MGDFGRVETTTSPLIFTAGADRSEYPILLSCMNRELQDKSCGEEILERFVSLISIVTFLFQANRRERRSMKPSTWRLAIIAVLGLTVLSSIVEIFSIFGTGGSPPWSGHWGNNRRPSSIPFSPVVVALERARPSERARAARR